MAPIIRAGWRRRFPGRLFLRYPDRAMMMVKPYRAAALFLLVSGCAPEADERPQLPYQSPPSAGAWLDVPWPSDLRRGPDGRLDFFSYPDPVAADLVRNAVSLAERQSGFALQPTIYSEVGAAVDPALLASDPETSLMASAAVQLLALDGPIERRPLALGQGGADDWMSPTVLHARPLMGWPLRPATRYALIITAALRDAAGGGFAPAPAIADGLLGQGPSAQHLAPLAAKLSAYQVAPEAILMATVFTTATPGAEMDALVAAQRQHPAPTLDEAWVALADNPGLRAYEARYPGLLWQHGAKPYAERGGGFAFVDGVAQLGSADEPMRVVLSLPIGSPPAGGWPVLIYQHGTGGDAASFLKGRSSYAADFAAAGIVMVGIEQPLHGARSVPGTDVEWHTFNPLNLEASAANLRQGALDLLLLRRMIGAGRLDAEQPEVVIDPERVSFFGHSQGGLSGALALPWLGALDCAVLSGAGAGLTYTVLERKDPVDFAAALQGMGGSQSALFASHPMVSLIQTAFEPSDPISTAPRWHAADAHHILLTSGRLDRQTPAITGDVLAMAGLLPQLEPVVVDLWRHELEGLRSVIGSISGNMIIGDQRLTAGYRQSAQGDHFAVFKLRHFRRMVQRFLRSCAAGDPTLIVP